MEEKATDPPGVKQAMEILETSTPPAEPFLSMWPVYDDARRRWRRTPWFRRMDILCILALVAIYAGTGALHAGGPPPGFTWVLCLLPLGACLYYAVAYMKHTRDSGMLRHMMITPMPLENILDDYEHFLQKISFWPVFAWGALQIYFLVFLSPESDILVAILLGLPLLFFALFFALIAAAFISKAAVRLALDGIYTWTCLIRPAIITLLIAAGLFVPLIILLNYFADRSITGFFHIFLLTFVILTTTGCAANFLWERMGARVKGLLRSAFEARVKRNLLGE